MKKLIFAVALLCSVFSASAAPAQCSGIEAGTKAYNAGDFDRAIEEWKNCVDNGIENGDLLYNLGNAYFRRGNLGFAIFYYKSALKLSPNNEDILHNLKYAQAMTKDKVEEEGEENPLLSTFFKIHHALSLQTQLWVLLAGVWIMVALCLVRKFTTSEKTHNVCTGILFVTVVAFSAVGLSAGYKVFLLETEVTGVVTSGSADVTSAPSDKSQTLNTLSEGTSFEVLSDQGNFVEIKLGDKIQGFVKRSEVGLVK